jgi:sugar-specific transcriptional regulator TrmB
LSQEKALKTLESLGFTQLDARVYVFLAKKGPQKAGDVAKCLKIPKQSIYFIIKNLQRDGIVTSTVERPARFSAVAFERVLDLFVNAKMEEAKQIQRNRDEILLDWQSIALTETDEITPKFAVIEGSNAIFSKIIEMAQQTNKHLLAIITVPNLVRADQLGIFDAIFAKSKEHSIQVKLLTELSKQNIDTVMSILKTTPKQGLKLEIRAPDFGLRLSSRMIIKDDHEAILFIDRGADFSATEKKEVCLWTDCESIVRSFAIFFEDLWLNATEIKKKTVEIKSGKPSPKTFLIKDAETAVKKYDEITCSSSRNIFMVTSSLGLGECWKDRNKIVEWVQRGVSVKIMAPITSENFEIANKLSKICEVKHSPADYVGTTIVDSQHLFQFKSPTSRKELQQLMSYFENTIYSDDFEFVQKTENMLKDIWNNAQIPSTVEIKAIIEQPLPLIRPSEGNILEEHKKNLRKIVGFNYKMEPKQGIITEKEVLDKIANAVRIPAKDPGKDFVRLYGAQANAAIYPQKNLNLPNFLILVYHNNRKSSFGAENSIQIHTQMNVAKHESYFPVAFVTDNPRGYKFRKTMERIRPTNEVAHLLTKDELDIQIHGEQLIAGWTVPIPLLPPKYILPPACIIFEGYGNTKTYRSEMIGPLNPRVTHEYNMLDAFVTFIHPFSRYHKSRSDGILLRESILTSYPSR